MPGLRRLRGARRRPGLLPRARHPAGEDRLRLRASAAPGRFSYYMDTYGMHGIHGRGPALATGIAAARDDLSIWLVTGDGDALSIGGNHLIHALRRNVPVKILLFNNQIYGLTKGQASPTSELGKVTKSTPFGTVDGPFNPVSLALGAEATFVARTVDTDKQHLPAMLRAAAAHEGAALIEIYQNCPVFNDGAFDALRDKKNARSTPSASSTASRSRSTAARSRSSATPHGSLRVAAAGEGERAGPRRARRRPLAGLRAVAARAPARRADADRHLPRRPAAGARRDRHRRLPGRLRARRAARRGRPLAGLLAPRQRPSGRCRSRPLDPLNTLKSGAGLLPPQPLRGQLPDLRAGEGARRRGRARREARRRPGGGPGEWSPASSPAPPTTAIATSSCPGSRPARTPSGSRRRSRSPRRRSQIARR